MSVVLVKNLRLSLDAIRPMLLAVAGLLVGGFIVSRLPPELVPSGLHAITVADLLSAVGAAAGAMAVGFAAWLAASSVQGDRVHGAEVFEATLPLSTARRVGAKISSLLLGWAAIVAIPSGLLGLSVLFRRSQGATDFLDYALGYSAATLFAVVVGGGCGILVATIVRGVFASIVTALFLVLVLLGIAGIAGRAAFGWLYRDFAEAARDLYVVQDFVVAQSPVVWMSAFVGAGLASAAALAIGIARLAHARFVRSAVRSIAVVAVVCGAAGVGASAWLGERVVAHPAGRSAALTLAEARGWSDERLTQAWLASSGSDPRTLDGLAFATAERLRSVAPERRVDDPLTRAAWSTVASEPGRYELVARGVHRFSREQFGPALIQMAVDHPLSEVTSRQVASVFAEQANLAFDFNATAAERRATLQKALEILIARGDPEAPRMRRAVEALRSVDEPRP